jgi:hypothetical protein
MWLQRRTYERLARGVQTVFLSTLVAVLANWHRRKTT